MKRLLYLLLTLALLISICPVTHADVIGTPMDGFFGSDSFNLFYMSHSDECYDDYRSYTTLTRVTVYSSPQSFLVKGHIPAQEEITIKFRYTDRRDIDWGFMDNGELSGWMPMDYLHAVYNTDDFARDYADQLQHLEEPIILDEIYAAEEIFRWEYPGSDSGTARYYGTGNMPHFWYLYTDPEGRLWGQLPRQASPRILSWERGPEFCWICIDDPTANFAELYPNGAPEVDLRTPPALPERRILPRPGIVNVSISVGVLACVGLTAKTLLKMKKAKRS